MTRLDCISWFADRFPHRTLPRSACLGCPYKSDADWLALTRGPRHELDSTIAVDDAIRQQAWLDQMPHQDGDVYGLHRRGPLRDVLPHLERVAAEGKQSNFFSDGLASDECSGVCFT